jgi:glycosyltransferase involved in cell wall biosynthesis
MNTTTQSSIQRQKNKIPDFKNASLFAIKANIFRLRRAIADLIHPVTTHTKCDRLSTQNVIAESITPLWTSELASEQELLAGKIHNLRIAIKNINGIEIQPHKVFSFWEQIGKPSRRKGYMQGREVRQGCIIPSIAGGLCQLSNALYSIALDAGFEIVERHAHTQIIAGSLAEIGRDATVFWNYVDLRFKVNRAVRIEAYLTHNSLIVRLKGEQSNYPTGQVDTQERETISDRHNCVSCQVSFCFRNIPRSSRQSDFGKTAYLVNEYWIEYDRYIQSQRSSHDILGIPLDGYRFHKNNYKWNQNGFAKVSKATFTTLMRAWESRNLPSQGSSLQNTLLKYDQKLAKEFAALLTYDVMHVVVMQNLLPWLWQAGVLQGRTFDVLMTRLPIDILQEHLELAHRLHPESLTLNDFRASETFAKIERQALQQANKIITPHTEIASIFSDQAILLDWYIPELKTVATRGNKILFPASTIGRKGAYEMRELAKKLNLEITLLGNNLEGSDFWKDVPIRRSNSQDCLDQVGLVILPAFVEHNPRILLRAIACGIPVIASSACGLGNLEGVKNIPVVELDQFICEIKRLLRTCPFEAYSHIAMKEIAGTNQNPNK